LLWQEYEFDIGRQKPAKLFTVQDRAKEKFKHRRRKVSWDTIEYWLRWGQSTTYDVQRNLTVSRVPSKLRQDNHHGDHPCDSLV
jgi:hypothetical protein